jgi:hypothetical protein
MGFTWPDACVLVIAIPCVCTAFVCWLLYLEGRR